MILEVQDLFVWFAAGLALWFLLGKLGGSRRTRPRKRPDVPVDRLLRDRRSEK